MTYASLIQPVLWAIAGVVALYFGTKALVVWRKTKKVPPRGLIIGMVAALVVAVIVIPAIGVVPPGNRGIVYRWNGGIDQKVRGEGITFLVPWFQHLTTSSVRTQKVLSKTVYAQSSDLQEITVVASINYHVIPDKAAYIYQTVGPQYASTVIQPALYQRTKAAVGKIKAEDFALERDHLALTVQKQLSSQLSGYGLKVEYVNIEDAIFDPDFVRAVKNKVIAQQEAKEQQNLIAARAAQKEQTIINAEATARSILIKATAQAKANKKIAASVTSSLISWQWITKWGGILPSTVVTGGGTSLFLSPTNGGSTPGFGSSPAG